MKVNPDDLTAPPEGDLEMQAWIDGELTGEARAAFERRLGSDTALQAAVAVQRQWIASLRAGEPVHPVPLSRPSYWGGIEARFLPEHPPAGRVWESEGIQGEKAETAWWRWLAPVFATLAMAVLVMVLVSVPKDVPRSVFNAQTVGPGIENLVANLNWTYHSDQDQLTIHWIE